MSLPTNKQRYFITGGAGFIGSHLADRLVQDSYVTVYDNLSSGKIEFIKHNIGRENFNFIQGDVLDLNTLRSAIAGHDVIFHLAANPEVRAGITDTDLDLKEGTGATYNVLEAMRLNSIHKLVFTSSSTVYGDAGTSLASEEHVSLKPISLYGASKVASEALISAFSHLFDIEACCFRLANVIGGRLTHGVIFDFINKLKRDPSHLEILGDGKQQKPYIHVSDTVEAFLFGLEHSVDGMNVYNIGPDSSTSVTSIAEIVANTMGLKQVNFEFTGGRQGWRGDVPQVRLDVSKMKHLGWQPRYTSDEAVKQAVKDILE